MRRYDEAIAVLQRALIHNSNFLPAHAYLAAVYSELGRKAEAQAAAAQCQRLSPTASLEIFRQRLPYKDPAVLERVSDALRKVWPK